MVSRAYGEGSMVRLAVRLGSGVGLVLDVYNIIMYFSFYKARLLNFRHT